GGFYVFQLFDFYAASGWALLWLLFFECIAISWSVGIDRWYEHMKSMIGYYPNRWWKFCWVFATPSVCMKFKILFRPDIEIQKTSHEVHDDTELQDFHQL
ncbi:hypothetical protein OSTOST_22388, partial [Ostertagia ostertagi]